MQEAQIARLEARISSADRAQQRQHTDGGGFHFGVDGGMDDASFDRRLAESTSAVSLSALPDRNYNQSCAVRKSSSNMELMQQQQQQQQQQHMSLSADTSQSIEDSPPSGGIGAGGAIAIGGPVSVSHSGSQRAITGSQFGPHDLSTIMDLSENESRFTDSMNESNTNTYEGVYPPGGGEIVGTGPESLVGMYLEVKGETENTEPSQLHNDSVDPDTSNVSSVSNSKIPKASRGQDSKRITHTGGSKVTKPTLASSAKTNKLVKVNSNVKKPVASGLPKPKPKSTSLSGSSSNSSSNSSQTKSKVPTSKPKPINYYPANLLSAANTAKANIAKMMKSVEEMYTPTVDHHVSTYIQDISDVTNLSELHVTKDGEGVAYSSESSDDDDNDNDHGDTNDNRQNKAGYHHDIVNQQQLGNGNHHSDINAISHGDGGSQGNGNSNNNGYQDSMQSSVQSTNNNNNNCIDKSTVSSLGNYSTPDVGMCVSDSNLGVSSNPGTGSPSDVDDFDDNDNEEDTPEVARDAESEDGSEYVEPEVDVFVPEVDTSHGRRSEEDDDSDSSLEPGMQRAKLFVAINQGQSFAFSTCE